LRLSKTSPTPRARSLSRCKNSPTPPGRPLRPPRDSLRMPAHSLSALSNLSPPSQNSLSALANSRTTPRNSPTTPRFSLSPPKKRQVFSPKPPQAAKSKNPGPALKRPVLNTRSPLSQPSLFPPPRAAASAFSITGLSLYTLPGWTGAGGRIVWALSARSAPCPRRGPPWDAEGRAKREDGFALPQLYAERARACSGGMMGGAGPRAAVRQAARVTAGGWGAGGWLAVRAAMSTQRDARGCGWAKAGRRLARRDACRGGRLVVLDHHFAIRSRPTTSAIPKSTKTTPEILNPHS
jgi:hypothetical protein